MINDILLAFYMTMELWGFLGLLCLFMVGEELVKFYKRKTVDNPTLW
jgi:hypothetical protein